jgi:flagellar hook-associated protein 3 FlgL
MPIQRISTFSVHQRTLTDAGRVQANLVDLQKQLSSGYKTDNFSGLDGQVERFTSIDATLRKTEVYIDNTEVALSRLNTTQVTMEKLIEVADDAKNLILLRRNPSNGESLDFNARMEALKTTAAALLNTTFEGRYIFGGTRTDTAPVISPIPTPVSTSVPDDSYYVGSTENLTVRVETGFELEYNVRADNEGFQKLFAAMAHGQAGHNGNGNDTILGEAFDNIKSAIEDINATQTRVNSNIVIVTDVNERHSDLKGYLKGLKEGIINTDIVGVSTQIATDQAVLQGAFQSFATISRLRLIDFIR